MIRLLKGETFPTTERENTMLAIVLRFIAALLSFLGALHPATPPTPRPAITCQEDMSCFRCSTMGNGVCGPVTIDLRHHTIIARNGVFPYTRIDGVYNNQYGVTYCVSGTRPIRQHDTTMLACSRSILR